MKSTTSFIQLLVLSYHSTNSLAPTQRKQSVTAALFRQSDVVYTLTAKDVILRPYFSFLYAEDIYIRLSAKFDFDRFSVWYNRRIFSYKITESSSFFSSF